MILRFFRLSCIECFLLLLLSVDFAEAQTLEPLEKFRDWTVYQTGTAPNLICFAQSLPKRSLPSKAQRGAIRLHITNRPNDDIRHEIGLRMGYPFSQKSRPFARIGKKNFQFFTVAQRGGEIATRAWLEDLDRQGALIRAMRNGVEMTFKGTSARGTLTTDYFSLLGLSAALKKIDHLCP